MENQPTLRDTTLTLGQPTENGANGVSPLLRYFDNYQRNHYVLNVEVYLTLLATQQAYNKQRKEFLDNRTSYIPSLSTDRIAVYKREASYGNVEILIGVRGTRISDIRDLNDDIGVITGNIRSSPFTQQYVGDIVNIRRAYSNLDDDQIYVGGHSLGAVTSLIASYILKINGFSFNGAQSVVDVDINSINILGRNYDLNGIYNYGKYENYVIRGDPIALTSRYRITNTKVIDVEKLNTMNAMELHSIDTMVDITIPYLTLEQGSVSRARRIIPQTESGIEDTPTTSGIEDDIPTATDALLAQRTSVENPIDNDLIEEYKKYLLNLPQYSLFF